MFIGYCPRHPEGTYRFIKVKNKQVVITRNYKWIEKQYTITSKIIPP